MAEAMSYWEAESEAIIERLRRQGRTSSIVAPPATTGAATEPTGPGSITSSAGSTTGAGSTTVSVTVAAAAARMSGEEESGQRQETPMEMDNPGMWHARDCHLYVSIPLNLQKLFSRAGSSLNFSCFYSHVLESPWKCVSLERSNVLTFFNSAYQQKVDSPLSMSLGSFCSHPTMSFAFYYGIHMRSIKVCRLHMCRQLADRCTGFWWGKKVSNPPTQ